MKRGIVAPITHHLMPAIASIREQTPKGAIIWTSWVNGYVLMYYTQRRVIADGQFMSGKRRAYVNLPLASNDPNFSRNFIRFYVRHGKSGLRQIYQTVGSVGEGLRWLKNNLGEPPEIAARSLSDASSRHPSEMACNTLETCRNFLFPTHAGPVFLFLNTQMLSSRWFEYGTWDAVSQEGEDSAILVLHHINHAGDTMQLNQELKFNVNDGMSMTLVANGKKFRQKIKQIVSYTGSQLEIRNYDVEDGFSLEWLSYNGFCGVMTRNVSESLFNQLFIRHTSNPNFFRHTVVKNSKFFNLAGCTKSMNHVPC